jgi:hypothetical protein
MAADRAGRQVGDQTHQRLTEMPWGTASSTAVEPAVADASLKSRSGTPSDSAARARRFGLLAVGVLWLSRCGSVPTLERWLARDLSRTVFSSVVGSS